MSSEQARAQFHRAFISRNDFVEAKDYLVSVKPELDDVPKESAACGRCYILLKTIHG